MAVFTRVDEGDLAPWLESRGVGALISLTGITGGIENSNYFVTTAKGRFVLTLFERLSFSEVPYYLGLMNHLAAKGLPCPAPIPGNDGATLEMLCGRPAALVTRLNGDPLRQRSVQACRQAGATLARMHLGAADYDGVQANLRGLQWCKAAFAAVMHHITDDQTALLNTELRFQSKARSSLDATLPSGAVHADLFMDNTLFQGDELTGVIDFYFAGHDVWIFDLAVAVNDWCLSGTDGRLDETLYLAFVDSYLRIRPFISAEKQAWPIYLRAAALRFWLSRLYDLHCPRNAQLLVPHDPAHFERILRERIASSPTLDTQ